MHDLIRRVAGSVAPRAAPIRMYLAGGAAVHWYTRARTDLAELARLGLIDAQRVERRAREALTATIGAGAFIEHNLREALELLRGAG